MNKLTAILLALLVATPAFAAGKKAKAAKEEKPAIEWTRKLDLGLVYADGNTKTTDLTYGLDLGAAGEKDSARFTLTGLYGEDRARKDSDGSSTKTKDSLETVFRYEHLISERQGFVLNFSYLRDDCADIDYSFILSPAYVLYLLKSDDLQLSCEIGPAAVWRRVGDEEDNYVTLRAAEAFLWNISDVATLEQTLEYLPKMGDADGDLINADVSLTSALTENLALKASVSDKYTSAPALGAEENDVVVSLALQLSI